MDQKISNLAKKLVNAVELEKREIIDEHPEEAFKAFKEIGKKAYEEASYFLAIKYLGEANLILEMYLPEKKKEREDIHELKSEIHAREGWFEKAAFEKVCSLNYNDTIEKRLEIIEHYLKSPSPSYKVSPAEKEINKLEIETIADRDLIIYYRGLFNCIKAIEVDKERYFTSAMNYFNQVTDKFPTAHTYKALLYLTVKDRRRATNELCEALSKCRTENLEKEDYTALIITKSCLENLGKQFTKKRTEKIQEKHPMMTLDYQDFVEESIKNNKLYESEIVWLEFLIENVGEIIEYYS